MPDLSLTNGDKGQAMYGTHLLLLLSLCQLIYFNMACARNPDMGARLHAPTALQASASSGKIRLSWVATDSTPEAEYNVYNSEQAEGPFRKVLTTTATQYDVVPDREVDVLYYCVTATLNGVAESACSNVVAVKSLDSAPPS